MTYFVLNYDCLGYFGSQKWVFGTLAGYHCVIFVCMKHLIVLTTLRNTFVYGLHTFNAIYDLFCAEYDSLGYFGGQKRGLVPFSGTIVLFSYA